MDKCPKCNAGIEKDTTNWIRYFCKTIHYKPLAGFPGSFSHGCTCKDRQIANLKERLEAWREYGRHQSFYMDEAYTDEEKISIQKLKDLGEI